MDSSHSLMIGLFNTLIKLSQRRVFPFPCFTTQTLNLEELAGEVNSLIIASNFTNVIRYDTSPKGAISN